MNSKEIKGMLVLFGTALTVYGLRRSPTVAPDVNPSQYYVYTDTTEINRLSQRENFCVRADDPRIMDKLKKAGVGKVRIWAPWEELLIADSQFRKAIEAAQDNEMIPLVVFSPNISLDEATINLVIKTVMDSYSDNKKGFIWVIGNEADNPEVNFWRGDIDTDNSEKLGTFGKFVGETYLAIRRHDRGAEIPIVIGALYKSNRLEELLYYGAINGVDWGDENILIGINAYNTDDNIIEQINGAEPAMEKYKLPRRFILTELGANTPELQNELDQRIATAKSLGIEISCIHEIKNIQDTDWVVTFDRLRALYYKSATP